MKRIPYVYLVINKTTGLAYYGSRTAENCNPREFWVTYFTSSKIIKKFIKKYGKDDFEFHIRKTFNTREEALKWELKVLKRLAVKSPKFLNQRANSSAIHNDKFIAINDGKIEIKILSHKDIPIGWIRGRLCKTCINQKRYYNPETLETISIVGDQFPPLGYIKGMPKRTEYYNPETLETISILKDNSPPENYIKGRGYSSYLKGKISAYNENNKIKYFLSINDIPKNYIIGLPKSGNKNKIYYNNPITNEIIALNEFDFIPLGFIQGNPKCIHNNQSNKNTIQIYDIETLDIKYINKNEIIPNGFNKGNQYIKNENKLTKNTYWVYNEITLESKMVKWEELEPNWKKGRYPKNNTQQTEEVFQYE